MGRRISGVVCSGGVGRVRDDACELAGADASLVRMRDEWGVSGGARGGTGDVCRARGAEGPVLGHCGSTRACVCVGEFK